MQDDAMKMTCKEAHRMVSLGLDAELSNTDKARLRLHIAVCEACVRFTAQMDFLRRSMRRFRTGD